MVILKYHVDKQRAEAELSRQNALLEALHSRRIKYDGVVDIALAAISYWVANSALVCSQCVHAIYKQIGAPLDVVLSLVPRKRLVVWLRQLVRATIVLLLTTMMRKRAIAIGLHSKSVHFVSSLCSYISNGSPIEYAKIVLASVASKAIQWRSGGALESPAAEAHYHVFAEDQSPAKVQMQWK